jgi:CheY-like chemotaxis protein
MSTSSHGEPRLLLLVDDDDDIREVAAAALELVDGFRIVTASSGLAAVEQAHEFSPDAILLDVMMPGLDGLETVVRLKASKETADIPVILLTAKVDGQTPQGTVAGVIAKPFDPMQLGSEVRRLLGWL